MDNSRPRHNDHLGVNKMGKNIRKSPLHQPDFPSNPIRPQTQPQVYNISKSDFRNIVQQLTGSPSRESSPRPPQNPPKPQNTRLHKIRPAPLTQINRPPAPSPPPIPVQRTVPVQPSGMAPPPPVQYSNNLVRASPQPMMQPMNHGVSVWGNTAAESPVSAYMRYLQSSFMDPGSNPPNQHQLPYQPQPEAWGQGSSFPNASMPAPPNHQIPSPRTHGQAPFMPNLPSPRMNGSAPMMHSLPSPRMNGSAPVMHSLPSPRMNGPGRMMPSAPSPRINGPSPTMPGRPPPPPPQGTPPGFSPSPTSQFLLPSPTGYPNPFSPRSPYPLLSPGVQYTPPFSPNFSFLPFGQPGILSPGTQPPPSPGLVFPISPSGYFPFPSPRWGDHSGKW